MSVDEDFTNDSEDDTYRDSKARRRNRTKRRKTINKRAVKVEQEEPFALLQPLLELVESRRVQRDEQSFEYLISGLLPEYLQDRKKLLEKETESDIHGQPVRPMTRYEVSSTIKEAESTSREEPTIFKAIALRKMKVQRERGLARLPEPNISTSSSQTEPLTPLMPPPTPPVVNSTVIDALYSIKTTAYTNSFASRIYGNVIREGHSKAIAVDWETRSPWIDLMTDIMDHYSLAHPDQDQPDRSSAPIIYECLQSRHLPYVHDLLARVFWTGVDVTDSLQYSPEKCTVIATYKHLVVGVAILSSPQETYITYLAVRAGWENSQIATSMLYHLIQLNPNKDITLHVSANNPAMLLYNRFGFKAEEFVVGFYEDYLDPQSRASKNAFRLRLRR